MAEDELEFDVTLDDESEYNGATERKLNPSVDLRQFKKYRMKSPKRQSLKKVKAMQDAQPESPPIQCEKPIVIKKNKSINLRKDDSVK